MSGSSPLPLREAALRLSVYAMSAVVMISTATVAKAQPSQQDNPGLTPRQNLYCEFMQPSYLNKSLGKQMKVSTRRVEEQSTENTAQQSKVCSVYFDQYNAATNNEFQVSRSFCFAPKPLKYSPTGEIENNK